MVNARNSPSRHFFSMAFVLFVLAVMTFGAQFAQAQSSNPQPRTSGLETYRLGSGDKVKVIVFGHEDLSGEYEIDGHSRVLEPGMVLTVEPGIYVPPSATSVDEIWRGLGIRVEDNVVVTRGEADILSSGICKTMDDIEVLMAS